MGSLVPIQDLNLPPPPFISPKIEPKLEPFDDLQPQLQNQQYPNFLNPTNYLEEQLPVPEISPEEQHVYAEFFKISELFRSAFGKKRNGEMEVLYPDLSIVPHLQGEAAPSPSVSTALVKKAMKQRSAELVRVADLGIEDQLYFRDLVRKTRMWYESLRIFLIHEEDNEKGVGFGKRCRGDLKAASLMKDKGLWLNRDKRIVGSIPGVSVGDVFFFRMELCVIGLHGQAQAGIDYVPMSKSSSGEPVATSIIVSGGYEDDEDAGDVLIYTGHGGQARNSIRQCVHQKLEGGNLALERSKFYDIEVRVIRGIKCDQAPAGKIYVYDGLYKIVDCWFDIGKSGFGVYKYRIVRIANQPEMGTSIFKFAAELRTKPLMLRPTGYLGLDISMGKENAPISLFNDLDSDRDPLMYDYLVKPIYPPFLQQMDNAAGCNCVSSCSYDCYCAQRNGGELPYDRNGLLLRGKPLIFECGAFCRCPPNCRNRVSQNGLKYPLEIFRSRETGWGVRPLRMIPAGSFICEYTGVVLTRQQAAIFTMNGDSLVDPSRFPNRWVEWGEISPVFPDFIRPVLPSAPPLDFAMDVSRMRNVACYFSHSSNPNVMVQFVMYNCNNVPYPHLMLFAMEHIPPLRELSLDYGVTDEWTAKLAICN